MLESLLEKNEPSEQIQPILETQLVEICRQIAAAKLATAQSINLQLNELLERLFLALNKPAESIEFETIYLTPDLDPKKTTLLPAAFSPVVKKVITSEKELLLTLYNAEPFYAELAPGTVNANHVFTDEENQLINEFNQQLFILIAKIESYQTRLELTDHEMHGLTIFKNALASRRHYAYQPAAYYAQVKRYLEELIMRLMDDSISVNAKAPIMHNLLYNIALCGSGIFAHLKMARDLLDNALSI
jgi:hypothetical protein